MDENNLYFYTTAITIRGPGGTLWDDVELIKRILEEHGLKVFVDDPYPHNMSPEQLQIRINDIRIANHNDGGHGVVLRVQHEWNE